MIVIGVYQNLGNTGTSFTINTSAGQFINAQGGNDTIQLFSNSTSANDTVNAGSGDDFVVAGCGDDTVFGGSGNDTLIGFDGNDSLYGGSVRDVLEGSAGTDRLEGGSDTDELWGGAGSDVMKGGDGGDKRFGDNDGSGQDENDSMSGGAGNDTLEGAGGSDRISGGGGADTFVFHHQNDFVTGHADYITDLSHAAGDRIDLSLIDARVGGTANDTFVFASAPSTQAGTIWVGSINDQGDQTVFINRDAGAFEHTILVHVDPGVSLQVSDFIL